MPLQEVVPAIGLRTCVFVPHTGARRSKNPATQSSEAGPVGRRGWTRSWHSSRGPIQLSTTTSTYCWATMTVVNRRSRAGHQHLLCCPNQLGTDALSLSTGSP
jgi:hypothetical protein